MKCLKILLIFVEFTVVLGIEPLVIVHGGAGSVAAHRVTRITIANIFKPPNFVSNYSSGRSDNQGFYGIEVFFQRGCSPPC